MTFTQQIITIIMVVLGTIITRFLSFVIFPSDREAPKYVQDIGVLLPSAVLGLLVIYCLKDVKIHSGNHGIPELIAVGIVTLLHIWKKNMFLSIAGGTIIYMALVQIIF